MTSNIKPNIFGIMREAGIKRKLDLNGGGPSKAVRTREDVRSMLPEFLISELQRDLYNPIQHSSNAHEIQSAAAKSPKTNLHCRACQNKFSSVEALENHNKKKTVNTGIHTTLPRSFKNDS